MTLRKILPLLLLPLMTSGCLSTAASIVKAPFAVAGQTVDWATTSQDEADRNFGRKMRKKEAKEGRERREYQKRCRKYPQECRGYDGYQAATDN
ncbi:hypothetical protein [Sphingomonas sp. Leaf17]|uniref:hypothetical protein n=1 Tax=Sphingomonas sp. Leaf17 TaxID=1735683 RepID=UPI000A914118